MATFPNMRGTDSLAAEQKPQGAEDKPKRRKRRRRRRRGQAQPYSARDVRGNARGQTLSNILKGTDAAGRNPADSDRERLKRFKKKKEADKRGR